MRNPVIVGIALAVLAACDASRLAPPPGSLVGVWGAEDAGLIVSDTSAHAHIGCTLGDVSGAIVPNSLGRFEATGLYNVNAYPVDLGIVHPARFSGTVTGGIMLLTITLTDTTVTLGPVRLTYGRRPEMQMCPICRQPDHQPTAMSR
jgi:hypothetical protein